ncbi:MAG: translation initiation factor IF-2 [Bacteroidales bacterium]|nr:translation initiation factor IF-2 [Bacteroidales bacterium]
MTDGLKATRLSKAVREFNVGMTTIVEFLQKKGFEVDSNPNFKIPSEAYALLLKEYSSDLSVKKESEKLILNELSRKKESVTLDQESGEVVEEIVEQEPVSKAPVEETPNKEDLKEEKTEAKTESSEPAKASEEKKEEPKEKAKEKTEPKEKAVVKAKEVKEDEPKKGPGPTVVGKIDLDKVQKPRKAASKDKVKAEEKAKAKTKAEEKPEPKAKDSVKAKAKDSVKTEAKEEPKTKEEVKSKKEAADSPKADPDEKAELTKEVKEPVETESEKEARKSFIKTHFQKLSGPTVVGKIELPKVEEKKKAPQKKEKGARPAHDPRKKRTRIRKDKEKVSLKPGANDRKGVDLRKKKKPVARPEVSDEDVQKQIKETLARLTTKGKSKGAKHRREKREMVSQKAQEEIQKQELEKKILKVTEFVSVNELASMMDIPVTDIISTCMSLGLFVSINQRLDAETMSMVAEEFDYEIEFVSAELLDAVKEDEDTEEELSNRPPIVTVMGHVDHGKTKLLDYIRDANVIAGEAGGITQHIGAYGVKLKDGRQITFLDTPGHEAFTAMRARGAQITDIAIIVVAADDGVMPQTVEAINHAAAAGVPIVFAINKIDKSSANPEKIKQELANMNFLVEDWGGKYQSQEISAKGGINIDELLEKVLLEAEMLDLKANPDKKATGTVIESSLDKGRGYIATILVKSGTLKIGDVLLSGSYFGHIKAMYNERGVTVTEAGPASPVLILGLNGAPQAGDKFNVMSTDREAKDIANKRTQLQREQGLRTQKHITLDEIGRRIAIGNFQELNVIVKGDVDGSIEALSDALIKLSTEEIQVNIRHKAVGQISESDILLAAASNAIVIGFQVRPSLSARKLAEKEEIDIRLYSIIYDAIDALKSAMEGMLSPEVKEEITGTIEIRETYNITKVGTVAGCYVKEGKISRNSTIRIIRDGIVIYTGELGSLKRFKDDVKEVLAGYECGLNINKFNNIKVGDLVEGFKEVEVSRTL